MPSYMPKCSHCQSIMGFEIVKYLPDNESHIENTVALLCCKSCHTVAGILDPTMNSFIEKKLNDLRSEFLAQLR